MHMWINFLVLVVHETAFAKNSSVQTVHQRIINENLGPNVEALDLSLFVVPTNKLVFYGNELKCDLDSHNRGRIMDNNSSISDVELKPPCCWLNWVATGNGSLWIPIKGEPNQWSEARSTEAKTENVYFTTMSTEAGGRAELMSCTLDCSDFDIDVTFKYWTSPDVRLKVCLRLLDHGDQLSHCHDVDKFDLSSSTMNFAEVSLPSAEYASIVIVAENISPTSFSIVDDIEVEALPCTTSTTSTTIETTVETSSAAKTTIKTTVKPITTSEIINRQACAAILCNFERDTCLYTNPDKAKMSSTGLNRRWTVQKDIFINKIRGVQGAGEGASYVATYLFPGDSAALETTDINRWDKDYVIRFLVYKSTANIELRLCCSNVMSCPYSTENELSHVTDYGHWNEAYVLCPKGTEKVTFYGYNTGENQGALAVDDIQLKIPSDAVSRIAQISAC